MPTYVYKFLDTGETIEVQQSFDEPTLTEAPHPSDGHPRPVKKVFTPVGITFRGNGFYKTDNRSGRNGTNGSTSDGSSKTETSGSSKSETSSSSKSETSSTSGSSSSGGGSSTSGGGSSTSTSSSGGSANAHSH